MQEQTLKLPRIMRLDQSDAHVFETAARPGEIAISGSFEFADSDPEALSAKDRLAFAQGFLGLETKGRGTVVSISSVTEQDRSQAVDLLTTLFMERYGAPNEDAARMVAEEEIAFAADLCAEHPINRLLLVERDVNETGIVERFRVTEKPTGLNHTKIWSIVPDEDDDDVSGQNDKVQDRTNEGPAPDDRRREG